MTPVEQEAYARGKRDGALEILDSFERVLAESDGLTAADSIRAILKQAIRSHRFVIRSLIEPTPVEPEIKEPEYVECPGCSEAGGADRPIYHEPPICAEPPPAPSKAEELPRFICTETEPNRRAK